MRFFVLVMAMLVLSQSASADFVECSRYQKGYSANTSHPDFDVWMPKIIQLDLVPLKAKQSIQREVCLHKGCGVYTWTLLPNSKMHAAMYLKFVNKVIRVGGVRYQCKIVKGDYFLGKTISDLCRSAKTSWGWNHEDWAKGYIAEAKKRGLTCGIKKPRDSEMSSFIDDVICRHAESNGKWAPEEVFQNYVKEAKKRGLSCGVGEITQTASPKEGPSARSNPQPEVESKNQTVSLEVTCKKRSDLGGPVFPAILRFDDALWATQSGQKQLRRSQYRGAETQIILLPNKELTYVKDGSRAGYQCDKNSVELREALCASSSQDDLQKVRYWCNDYLSRVSDKALCKSEAFDPSYFFYRKRSEAEINEASKRKLNCRVLRWRSVDKDLKKTQPPAIAIKPAPDNRSVPKSPESPPPPVIAQKPKQPPKPEQPTRPKTQNEEDLKRASSGSGFAVSSAGHIITNHHVINGCSQIFVHYDGKAIPTDIITFDQKNDLALLKGSFKPDAIFPLSNKGAELLQEIYVAGYPFGWNYSTSVKVTKGIISSLTGIGNNFSEIQIDAALQKGNSGGPILDEYGNIVGVAVSKLDTQYAIKNFGAIPENINFGVKANVVRSLLESQRINAPLATNETKSLSELGKKIRNGTYYISCWMTVAQIEAMRSKKVMFDDIK